MPEDSDRLVTSAVDTTVALIEHREGESKLLADRARYIWDLGNEHGLNLRAIADLLKAELRARGITEEQISQMGRLGLGISHAKLHAIVSGPRP